MRDIQHKKNNTVQLLRVPLTCRENKLLLKQSDDTVASLHHLLVFFLSKNFLFLKNWKETILKRIRMTQLELQLTFVFVISYFIDYFDNMIIIGINFSFYYFWDKSD